MTKEKEKKMRDIEVDETICLHNTDSGESCVAVLRDGARRGGCEHSLYLAWQRDISDDDSDRYDHVTTDAEECDDLQISL